MITASLPKVIYHFQEPVGFGIMKKAPNEETAYVMSVVFNTDLILKNSVFS